MINIDWCTEEFFDSIGYYKVKDDGQYGEYMSKHWVINSPTYGMIPKDKRQINFNRDAKYGVFIGIREDWNTRNVFNGLINDPEHFKIIANSVT